MSDGADGSIPQGIKACKVCGEPIRQTARKCIKCGSYQGWFSGLGLSASILALLTALLSVATVAVPVIRDALTPKDSSLAFSLQGEGSPDVISVLVTNSGIRPGTVGGGVLFVTESLPFREPSPQMPTRIHRDNPTDLSSATIIGPGESALINYELVEDEPAPLDAFDAYNMFCDLNIFSTSFRGYISFNAIELRSFDEDGQGRLNSCQKFWSLFEKQMPLFPKESRPGD
jgi:hypothetical protein